MAGRVGGVFDVFAPFRANPSEKVIPQATGPRRVSERAKLQLQNKEIKKLPWGGRDPVLDTPEKQLFFTLFYLKTYPTFDVLGFHFGLSAGHARDYLVFFLRVMNLSLTTLKTLPVRHLGQVEDFKQVTDNDKEIIIDGIEVPCVRPGDPEQQKTRYSGKKKDICSRC